MADHLDAPGLKSPAMDAKIDITDVYAFQSPTDATRSVLIMNVNPLAPTLANSFEDGAIYELKVDVNGDAVAEISFKMTFSPFTNGTQYATVRRATGADAAGDNANGDVILTNAPVAFFAAPAITRQDPYTFFAGIRSDPFFFDLMGFLNNLQFTGSDFFIDKNVYSMVLEMPSAALGTNSKVGIWGRVLKPNASGGGFAQVDRMGRPAINTVFNHGDDKNTFNSIPPTQDRPLFQDKFVAALKSFGHPDAEALQIAQVLLPDILTYDYSSSAGFLNGRKLQDDVIDIELNLVTAGKVTTDKVGPHTDYLSTFPYVGVPHGIPLSATLYEALRVGVRSMGLYKE